MEDSPWTGLTEPTPFLTSRAESPVTHRARRGAAGRGLTKATGPTEVPVHFCSSAVTPPRTALTEVRRRGRSAPAEIPERTPSSPPRLQSARTWLPAPVYLMPACFRGVATGALALPRILLSRRPRRCSWSRSSLPGAPACSAAACVAGLAVLWRPGSRCSGCAPPVSDAVSAGVVGGAPVTSLRAPGEGLLENMLNTVPVTLLPITVLPSCAPAIGCPTSVPWHGPNLRPPSAVSRHHFLSASV